MPIRPTQDAPNLLKDGLDSEWGLGGDDGSLDDLVDQLGYLAAQSTLLSLSDKAPTEAAAPPKVPGKPDAK